MTLHPSLSDDPSAPAAYYTALEAAVLRTILYADVFHFALTPGELCHFLIADRSYSRADVEAALCGRALAAVLAQTGTAAHDPGAYIALHDRAHLIGQRAEREALTAALWPHAVRAARWLSYLPFVRMVALTGALSMHNPAHPRDDIDFCIVTADRRVWLARACAVVVVRGARLAGIAICPNYVLAESAIAQQRCDLFIAHEVCQMIPMFGHDVYAAMRAANPWTAAHLPHAATPYHPADAETHGRAAAFMRGLGERVLGGRVGDWLEGWEYARKVRRFRPRLKSPHAGSAAIIDHAQVKGHFDDHGHPALIAYRERLTRYGLA